MIQEQEILEEIKKTCKENNYDYLSFLSGANFGFQLCEHLLRNTPNEETPKYEIE